MNRRWGLATVLIVVAAAFAGWWMLSIAITGASGLHEIDGYWLGPETTCTAAAEPNCDAAIQTAAQALEGQMSGAAVVRATVATPSCSSATFVLCTTSGGVWNVVVVLDFGDGSRHAVGVACLGLLPAGTVPSCRPVDVSALEPSGP